MNKETLAKWLYKNHPEVYVEYRAAQAERRNRKSRDVMRTIYARAKNQEVILPPKKSG